MKTGCVIVAGGRGTRAGLGYNKAFYPLAGRSVLSRTVEAISRCGGIDEIVLVLGEADMERFSELSERENAFTCVKTVVAGGETRRESVYNGLRALSADTDIAVIHDAARPFVTKEIMDAVLSAAQKTGSGVICCRVTDTIKRVDEAGRIVETVDRNTLRSVQTPQAFSYSKLMAAHEACARTDKDTDDASLYERMVGSVTAVTADSAAQNIKLTTREDFITAQQKLAFPRIGTGYDVHRLTENRRLILCGVDIPFEKGLLGHSDADVALHALMDAMLGAAALGDIGHLFPDTSAEFEGIDSRILLKRTNEAVAAAGYEVSNCDVTIVCQRPKLAPYIAEMRENVARTLGISANRVSVKATTTEKLGFEGEGLGISAQATVLLTPKCDL